MSKVSRFVKFQEIPVKPGMVVNLPMVIERRVDPGELVDGVEVRNLSGMLWWAVHKKSGLRLVACADTDEFWENVVPPNCVGAPP